MSCDAHKMATSANLMKTSSFVVHCADDGESWGLCLAFQFLGLSHTPLLIFDENVALKGPVISNTNNQSSPISWALNGLERNIKRFCLLRSFLPQRLSLSSFVFVCQGRPHTGTAVTGPQSYFLRRRCRVNRHASAGMHANRRSHIDDKPIKGPHSRFSKHGVRPDILRLILSRSFVPPACYCLWEVVCACEWVGWEGCLLGSRPEYRVTVRVLEHSPNPAWYPSCKYACCRQALPL